MSFGRIINWYLIVGSILIVVGIAGIIHEWPHGLYNQGSALHYASQINEILMQANHFNDQLVLNSHVFTPEHEHVIRILRWFYGFNEHDARLVVAYHHHFISIESIPGTSNAELLRAFPKSYELINSSNFADKLSNLVERV